MARKRLIVSNSVIYHITNRSNNKEWFYIPTPEVWKIFLQVLLKASKMYRTEIHSLVLMSNHYHLLVSTPESNLHLFMRYFQTEVCRQIQKKANRVNHVFGTRYKWTVLEDEIAYAYVLKYVARNPVRAGLCALVEDYPYSTFYKNYKDKGLIKSPHLEMTRKIPVNLLEWLNTPTDKEIESLIGKGLRRYEFKFTKSKTFTKKLNRLRKEYGVEGLDPQK